MNTKQMESAVVPLHLTRIEEDHADNTLVESRGNLIIKVLTVLSVAVALTIGALAIAVQLVGPAVWLLGK